MKEESPRRARRRRRLQSLLDEIGGAARAAEDTGTPRTHFTAMLKARRGLGDALAAKLEATYKKPSGWFDEALDWPFSKDLHEKVAILSDEALLRLENVMRAHLDMPQQSLSLVAETRHLASSKDATDEHHYDPEEGAAQTIEDAALPAPSSNDRQKVVRPAHKARRGGA